MNGNKNYCLFIIKKGSLIQCLTLTKQCSISNIIVHDTDVSKILFTTKIIESSTTIYEYSREKINLYLTKCAMFTLYISRL